jgi:hypothetical protein
MQRLLCENKRKAKRKVVKKKRFENFNCALHHILDRDELSRNPLAQLPIIDYLVDRYYKDHIFPRGIALHSLFSACINKIYTELKDDPKNSRVGIYLKRRLEGLSCNKVSQDLELTREHVSRTVRIKAIRILAEVFEHESEKIINKLNSN